MCQDDSKLAFKVYVARNRHTYFIYLSQCNTVNILFTLFLDATHFRECYMFHASPRYSLADQFPAEMGAKRHENASYNISAHDLLLEAPPWSLSKNDSRPTSIGVD